MDERLSTDPAAIKSMQDNLRRNRPAIVATYSLIGAILLFGAAGFFADQYFGTKPWCLLAGLAFGICLGFYELVKVSKLKT